MIAVENDETTLTVPPHAGYKDSRELATVSDAIIVFEPAGACVRDGASQNGEFRIEGDDVQQAVWCYFSRCWQTKVLCFAIGAVHLNGG
jgi:hypothetical protein